MASFDYAVAELAIAVSDTGCAARRVAQPGAFTQRQTAGRSSPQAAVSLRLHDGGRINA